MHSAWQRIGVAQRWLTSLAKGLVTGLALSVLLAAPCLAQTATARKALRLPDGSAKSYSFAVLSFAQQGDGLTTWQQQLQKLADSNLSFVVANGIKATREACSDQLYQQRKSVLDEIDSSVILNLAAQDWSECLSQDGSSNAIERLSRLRELFFSDEFSLGTRRLELSRLSLNPKFRNFPENARWEINGVLYATIHLPANNNRYLAAAGRNSEFEDRQVANREWLKKLFALANLRKEKALVLFADGNLMGAGFAQSGKLRSAGSERQRDGFADLQQRLMKLADKFNGRILLIDHAATSNAAPSIQWRGKIGVLSLSTQQGNSYRIKVHPSKSQPFEVNRKAF